jgi:hypothetical protein
MLSGGKIFAAYSLRKTQKSTHRKIASPPMAARHSLSREFDSVVARYRIKASAEAIRSKK